MNSKYMLLAFRIDPEYIKIGVVVSVFVIIMLFILAILRKVLEHKLKNKILDKGVSEDIASTVLQKELNKEQHVFVKWFLILLCVGGGLLIVSYKLPLGIHSFAIMAISISVSFLLYYLYLQRFKK